jgi:hypothetical protein
VTGVQTCALPISLKVKKTGEDVVVPAEELREALGSAEGGTIYAAQPNESEVTLARRDTSFDARRARGKAFINRYRKTLNDLAK